MEGWWDGERDGVRRISFSSSTNIYWGSRIHLVNRGTQFRLWICGKITSDLSWAELSNRLRIILGN